MARTHWRPAARYGLPGLLVGLAVAWAFGSDIRPLAQARATQASQAAETIALTAEGAGGAHLLYLIDPRTRSLAVYEIDTKNETGATIKLKAARQCEWDLRLRELNNQAPSVDAIESMVSHIKNPKK